jgi:CheY-like chemotaxis protein
MRILLVDDDPMLLTSMQTILEGDGHQVVVAMDGRTALGIFRTQSSGGPFDVVVTDFSMPDLNGSQLARSIKEISPTTPVILMTGWGPDRDAGAAGVDYVLGKPPRLQAVREALAHCIKRRP